MGSKHRKQKISYETAVDVFGKLIYRVISARDLHFLLLSSGDK
jgi:hypothetical protein